jgi:hypothetical protein
MGEFRELTADLPDDWPVQLAVGENDAFTYHEADASADLTNRRVVITGDPVNQPAGSRPRAGILTALTLTARQEGNGLLVSLKSEGDFSDEMIDRRFYSIADVPPADLPPGDFWAVILGQVAGFLVPEPDDDDGADHG